MDTVAQFTVKGLTVKIHQDSDPESPREWDNLGTMVCWHRRYNLGDEKPTCESHEFNPNKHAVCLPLFLYDHSGITMSTGPFGCPWDSGQVGWIYCDAEEIRKEYSVKRISQKTLAKVRAVLEQEVKTYDEFLTGQVYGFVVEDAEGNHLDSCWGFYGLDYCKTQAKTAAEYQAKEIAETDESVQRTFAL